MPAYIFIQQPGEFFENSMSRLEIHLGKCLFIELTYELYLKNLNDECIPDRPESCTCMNYGVGRTYDDCTEDALEKNMMTKMKCVVPFLRSNHTVCKSKAKTEQVFKLRRHFDAHNKFV